MTQLYDYGLDWLDQEALFNITKKWFGTRQKSSTTSLDPFTTVIQASIVETSISVALEFEESRKVNKTIANKVGNWHQEVLGLSDNWESILHSGVIDLQSVGDYRHPDFGKPVIVEVKNRYNTIKGSDEKNLWDSLEQLARSQDKIAYVFQIIPKDGERFDRPWKVSGRDSRDHVRHCDGRTAYEMVFERKDALEEIFNALPKIMADVRGTDHHFDPDEVSKLFQDGFKTE